MSVIPLLKSNVERSENLAYVTSSDSFVARFNTPSATFASPASSIPSALSNVYLTTGCVVIFEKSVPGSPVLPELSVSSSPSPVSPGLRSSTVPSL